MNALDYYENPEIVSYLSRELRYISNREDREDCQQEVWVELYNFMPLDTVEAKRLIKRVCEKFKRGRLAVYTKECDLEEAGI